MYFKLVALCLLGSISLASSCGSRERYASLDISKLDNPLYLMEGRKFDAAFTVKIFRTFPTKFKVDVSLKRKVWFAWVPVPCMNKVGSCTYDVTCDMINKWQEKAENKQPCPAQPQTVTRSVNLVIPKVPKVVKIVGSGTYQVKVTIKDLNGRCLAEAERKIEVKF